MNTMLLSIFDDWASNLGVEVGLVVALALVTVAIGIGLVVVGILRLIIFGNYWIANRPTERGLTGEEAATEMLQRMGIYDVEVVESGFFRALFYGNHYNPQKKTIYLRRSTFRGKNITYVALAVQKAALVRQSIEDSGKFLARWRLQKLAFFGPFFFLPIILAGLIVDVVLGFTGIPTIIAALVSFSLFVCSMVLAGLTVSVEKRGTRDAMDLLSETDLLTPEEQEKAQKVLNVYVLTYITDFILTILKLIQLILKILLNMFSVFSKRK